MIVASTDSLASYPFSSAGIRPHHFIPCFIEISCEINEFMKMHVVNLTEKGLKQADQWIYGAKAAVMGPAYKNNINNLCESPSLKVIEVLVNLGTEVWVYCCLSLRSGRKPGRLL